MGHTTACRRETSAYPVQAPALPRSVIPLPAGARRLRTQSRRPHSRDGSHCCRHTGETGREPPKAVVVDIPLHAGGRDARAPGPCSLQGWVFWGSPCVPSFVSGIRTPKIPLLPLWEKGARGMRGKRARECSKPLISPRNSTPERAMQRRAPHLVSGGFRRQHTVVQVRKRVINLFDCGKRCLIGIIEHIARCQFTHVPASRQVHPRTVRFAGIVSSS